MTDYQTDLEIKKRIQKLDIERKEIDAIKGRAEPNIDNMIIGESRKFMLVILHIDITNFKKMVGQLSNREKFRFLNIFLSEMTYVVHDFDGVVEKYVGDRVTAMFGIGVPVSDAVLNAIYCARAMRYEIKKILNPYLKSIGLPEFQCTIGMDLGETWISKVGIRNDNQFTLVGNAVNVASELEEMASPDQILLGSAIFQYLPNEHQLECTSLHLPDSWKWVIANTNKRYGIYVYKSDFEPSATNQTKSNLEYHIAQLEFKLNRLSKYLENKKSS